MSEAEAELDQMNGAFRDQIRGWLDEQHAERELPPIGMDLLLAILVGPSQDFARRWLGGRATTSLRDASDLLARAAWLSLRELRKTSAG